MAKPRRFKKISVWCFAAKFCRNKSTNLSETKGRSLVFADAMFARLRYTEDVNKSAPATEFIKRAFAEKDIVKGIICHGMWLVAPVPELVRGRPVVAHNNLLGDVRNMGAIYTDEDVVVDGDLVTARTGGHCHLFAKKIVELLGDGR